MHLIEQRISAATPGRPLKFGDHFLAHSFRASDFEGLMDPLLMVDHFWMSKDTFGAHPHAGMSALTYVFPESESAHHNRDSLGNELLIEPGDLHWFCAGSGAVHHEFPEGESPLVHALQIFVALPLAAKDADPFALHLAAADVPLYRSAATQVRVVSGQLGGVHSPFQAPQPFSLFDGRIDSDAKLDMPLPDGWGVWVYVVSGEVQVGSSRVPAERAVALTSSDTPLRLRGIERSHFVLMAGARQSK